MQPEPSLSVEEYLSLEAIAGTKHEYWGGQRFAMAGADLVHNQLTSNLVIALGTRLHPRGCRVLVSDQRVQVGLRYFYPDVVVVCQVPDLVPPRPTSLRNPELVVEILSESIASLDHHVKLYAYLQVESLKEYWMVYQDTPRLSASSGRHIAGSYNRCTVWTRRSAASISIWRSPWPSCSRR
jgi:Uma2 family endonuclease